METLFLDALSCTNKSRPPVWLMRQAGRYLPEYRAIRSRFSFVEMYRNPEIAAEVTLMPIRRFGMDAAILFSDILIIPEALGVGLHFKEEEGPIIEKPLKTANDVRGLSKECLAEKLEFVACAIQNLLPVLKVPLIGFCGAPFTLASYMIEGGTSKDLKKTKQWMFQQPHLFHELLTILADCAIVALSLQIQRGVHAVQIFDSWSGALAYHQFVEFSLRYIKRIIDTIKKLHVPIIVFSRSASVFAKDLADANPSAISIDWNVDLTKLKRHLPSHIALQGNLDPDILYAPDGVIKREVQRLLDGMRGESGYIVNLGHGVKPDVAVSAVMTLVETVKNG